MLINPFVAVFIHKMIYSNSKAQVDLFDIVYCGNSRTDDKSLKNP